MSEPERKSHEAQHHDPDSRSAAGRACACAKHRCLASALGDDSVLTAPAPEPQHYAKPSPDVYPADTTPATPTLQTRTAPPPDTYQPYNPSTDTHPLIKHPADNSLAVTDDPNSGVVIDVPAGPNDLPAGTLLRARIQTTISTKETRSGTRFTALLATDVSRNGKVFLPAGSTIHGRITEVRGGRRIGGRAAIRLQANSVTLPDGTAYQLDADVVDLAHFKDAHVTSEGAIVDNDHAKSTIATVGLATGSAAAAGALLGGVPGAVVGASIGAGAGTIWWLKRDRQETLPAQTEIIFALDDTLHFGDAPSGS